MSVRAERGQFKSDLHLRDDTNQRESPRPAQQPRIAPTSQPDVERSQRPFARTANVRLPTIGAGPRNARCEPPEITLGSTMRPTNAPHTLDTMPLASLPRVSLATL